MPKPCDLCWEKGIGDLGCVDLVGSVEATLDVMMGPPKYEGAYSADLDKTCMALLKKLDVGRLEMESRRSH